jgi:elongator complex protein 3
MTDNNLIALLKAIESNLPLDKDKLFSLQKQYTKDNGEFYSKVDLIKGYKQYAGNHGLKEYNSEIIKNLQKKPTRTHSGVAPVTVFTKPYPCPGNCIFCPLEYQVPKSYLSSEPGVQRAERNKYNPYLQTYNRVQMLSNMGHPVDKVELIILGGSWSAYPQKYQRWFISQCFQALNDFKPQSIKRVTGKPDSDEPQTTDWQTLADAHLKNETAYSRCVGLVVETRPDLVDQDEVLRLRKLGCTKVQLGLQFLDDKILMQNQRGHSLEDNKRAVRLLRQAGFKIHAHWMPNLYGSNVNQDKQNYLRLFKSLDFKPDELKIYPCSLLENTKLMEYYQQDKWQPYSEQELKEILKFCLTHTPQYCRLTRVVRDIPSTEIVAGDLKTNFREEIEQELKSQSKTLADIRAREIKRQDFNPDQIKLDKIKYQTTVSQEIFLQYIIPSQKEYLPNHLLGFLRLSLPKKENWQEELKDSGIIREVHVYGPALPIGKKSQNKPQHLGLGKKLINQAKVIVRENGYKKLAVISAVGTRQYYKKLGFKKEKLYQLIEV